MKKICFAFLLPSLILVILLPSLTFATNQTTAVRQFDLTPRHGQQTLDLKELWRAGGEDEEVFFGRITDVKMGPDGNTYVLDNQLCQVMVFSPEGQHLRNLSREGDGPGELRQPVELAFLSDDVLGIGMGFPGKVISLRLDGTPAESFFPIGQPADGNIGLLMGFQFRDGVMAACGGQMVFDETGQGKTQRFLTLCNHECEQPRHLLEKATPLDLTGQRFVEADAYYFERAWTLGTQGRIFAANLRNTYQISVFDNTGALILEFGRPYQARKRTQADKEKVSPVISINNNPNMEIIAEDNDPCIVRLIFNPDTGNVLALTPQGREDQPDDILQKWDVFNNKGDYLKQVNIPLGSEMNDGSIYLVGNGKLLVVKGSAETSEGDATEAEPLEVICYEINKLPVK